MVQVITENIDFLEALIAIALIALGIAQAVRILYMAGVITFKFTNRGVGK